MMDSTTTSDTLNGTTWDVVIVGTDVAPALLALALSRSGKKVLHVDENEYYGGSHAAFTLQEAQEWVEKVKAKATAEQAQEPDTAAFGDSTGVFLNASIRMSEEDDAATGESATTKDASGTDNASASASKLSYSRAYSLSLSPQIIYSRSQLLRVLVSSKAFKQLEFLTVGSFWVYSSSENFSTALNDDSPNSSEVTRVKKFRKVPNGREDIFSDKDITPQEKRNMMRFLRFISQYEQSKSTCQPWASRPLASFLTENFEIPASIHNLLYALTMLSDYPENITTEMAMDCFHRHVTSMGIFGPGFPAVVPRWGGMSEVAQVACRAMAVGGGVYVLGKGVEWAENPELNRKDSDPPNGNSIEACGSLKLGSGEKITTKWLIGSEETLSRINNKKISPNATAYESYDGSPNDKSLRHYKILSRSVSIVSSPLDAYFAHRVEGAPAPAVAVVYFPAGAFELNQPDSKTPLRHAPIQVLVHSSDTGECPSGQCVLHASTMMPLTKASSLLDKAVEEILSFATADEIATAACATSESLEPPATLTEGDAGNNDEQPTSYGGTGSATTDATSFPPRSPKVLWSMHYEQNILSSHRENITNDDGVDVKNVHSTKLKEIVKNEQPDKVTPQSTFGDNHRSRPKVAFLPAALQQRLIPSNLVEGTSWTSSDYLVFDDEVVDRVRRVWEEVMGVDFNDDNGGSEGTEGGGGIKSDDGSGAERVEHVHEHEHEQSAKDDLEFMKFGDREVDADADNVEDDDVNDDSNDNTAAFDDDS